MKSTITIDGRVSDGVEAAQPQVQALLCCRGSIGSQGAYQEFVKLIQEQPLRHADRISPRMNLRPFCGFANCRIV